MKPLNHNIYSYSQLKATQSYFDDQCIVALGIEKTLSNPLLKVSTGNENLFIDILEKVDGVEMYSFQLVSLASEIHSPRLHINTSANPLRGTQEVHKLFRKIHRAIEVHVRQGPKALKDAFIKCKKLHEDKKELEERIKIWMDSLSSDKLKKVYAYCLNHVEDFSYSDTSSSHTLEEYLDVYFYFNPLEAKFNG